MAGGERESRPEGPGEADGADPVMEMVREQLERSSPPSTHALYGRAIYMDPSLRRLSLRQFHARYPLQVKRAMKRASAPDDAREAAGGAAPDDRSGPGAADGGERRKKLRRLFLDLARRMSRPEAAAGGAFVAARKLPTFVDRAVRILEGRA